jgi:23S rRNA (uracil1939-C5)-methyltransferase
MEKLKIERLDNFGRGIGYLNNKVIFIPNALPDETVLCELEKESKNYLVGKNLKLETKSEKRVEPKCPYYNECGGCSLQHLSYEDTKQYKIDKISNLLKRNNLYEVDLNFIDNKDGFNYRNKIELKLEDGHIGFYQNKTHDLVEIKSCVITKNCINKVIPDIVKNGIKNGNITIRANYNDELLIIINTKDNFDYKNIIKNNKVSGIIVNGKVIHNDSYFIELIDNKYFKVSYDAFFQVNEFICSKLFEIIDKNIEENSIVADLYCGVGTLSIVASSKAKKVYGIEIVENAVLDAIENAKINHKNNIYFNLGKVSNVIDKINDKLDTIIVDPPRAGLDKYTIKTILKYKPKSIIYTSCDPLTLIRDLKELTKSYNIKEINLLDMFSYTYHVESVCVLNKR